MNRQTRKVRPIDTAVDALATHRLTRLVTTDTITATPRNAVLTRLAHNPDNRAWKHWAYELLTCPWCLSTWIALGVVTARHTFPRTWDMLARALAFSDVTGLLTQASDRLEQ